MKEIKNMVVIGSGNIAWHMVNAFGSAGIGIRQVLARNSRSSGWISQDFRVPIVNRPEDLDREADLYLLAVRDDQLKQVAESLHLKDQLLVHCSGFTSLDILKEASASTGVIWPLQTLTARLKVAYTEIPFFIEGNSMENEGRIEDLVGKISRNIYSVDSRVRQKVHLAAVITSNLTNHLYSISESILSRENISFDVLVPIILETAAKAASGGPRASQTGPAARNDLRVIHKHLELLSEDPAYQEIYRLLSENIIHQPKHK